MVCGTRRVPNRRLSSVRGRGRAAVEHVPDGALVAACAAEGVRINRVTSRDGTSIRVRPHGNRTGALILVGGGLDDGSESAPLATELAEAFTAYNYARRGRGDSGDTLPYALAREIEMNLLT